MRPVLCQECGKRPATVHLTQIINGQKKELHLCEQCARARGEVGIMGEPFSIPALLSSIITDGGHTFPGASQAPGLKCDRCGLSYSEFARTGMLGCRHCYQAFENQLESVLRRLHGTTVHRGKVPNRSSEDVRVKREISRLQDELTQVVMREEYEKAAQIRDRIKELEKRLG